MRIEAITHPADWDRAAIAADTTWERRLTLAEIADLERALGHALARGKPLFEMEPQDLPLGAPSRGLLREALAQIGQKTGFQLLRGFPVERWSAEQMRVLFWGLGLHFGVARPQGKTSLFLTDVRNTSDTDYRSSTGRGYNSNAALDFHTDSGDIVGLMCLQTAASGGTSAIASGVRIHNEMLAQRPDLVEALYAPLHFSRQGDEAPEERPYYRASVFGSAQGRFACFVRPTHHVLNAQKNFPELPRLTPLQQEALDLLSVTMQRDDLCFHMDFEPGDIQLIDNYSVVHARTNYTDHPDPARKRHLLRLWLALPGGQPLPDQWSEAFKDVAPGAVRGGVRGREITPDIVAFERRMADHHGMHFRIDEAA